MLKKRLVACLLIRDGMIVQSIGFKRYLPIGQPRFSIEFVVRWDVDEIVLLDMSATPNRRGPNFEVIEHLSHHCFVPLTVGGGVRTIDDVRGLIRAGADKASLNSAAFRTPELISKIADAFGSQCAVISMDCKKIPSGDYRVFLDSGTVDTGLSPVQWARDVESRGAGEIFLNSIDRDGSRVGYDAELISQVANAVRIPVVACGGVGRFSDFPTGIQAGASAVAEANIFHFVEHSTILAKAHLFKNGVDVRLDSRARYQDREFDGDGRLMMLSSERLLEMEISRGRRDLL